MSTTITAPKRLPDFEFAGWRFVSDFVDRGDDYTPANDYDRWLIDVYAIEGDAYFANAFEVRYDGVHFELHAGPNFPTLSGHFDHAEQLVFDDVFEHAYIEHIIASCSM